MKMSDVPIEAKLVCEYCAEPELYHEAALVLYATGIISPNTFWWWHFPRLDNPDQAPYRCSAGKLFEHWLKQCIKDNS